MWEGQQKQTYIRIVQQIFEDLEPALKSKYKLLDHEAAVRMLLQFRQESEQKDPDPIHSCADGKSSPLAKLW